VARRVRRALAEAGIPFDRKRFVPHITVLRRAELGRCGLPALTVPSARMTVRRISLMRSDRGKSGMIYTELGAVEAEE
jgi:2'-5' RNA ligase